MAKRKETKGNDNRKSNEELTKKERASRKGKWETMAGSREKRKRKPQGK